MSTKAKKKSATASTAKRVKPDPPISEARIKRVTDSQVFARGEDYFDSGAITKPIRIGNILTARCHGSQYEPYHVRVTFNKKGVVGAVCDCPYDWGGYCKHIAALLLTHVRTPETIAVKPTVKELLAESEREDIIGMIAQMVDHYPELYGIIDGSGISEEEDEDYHDDEW